MAEEQRIAVINLKSGLVENVAVIKDGDGSTAPIGSVFIHSDEADIGDSWDGTQIVKAKPVIDVQLPVEMLARSGEAMSDEIMSDSDRIAALEVRVSVLEARLSLSVVNTSK